MVRFFLAIDGWRAVIPFVAGETSGSAPVDRSRQPVRGHVSAVAVGLVVLTTWILSLPISSEWLIHT